MKERRWYIDVALALLVVGLAALVYLQLGKPFSANAEKTEATEAGGTEASGVEMAEPTLSPTQSAATQKADFEADALARKTAKDFELVGLDGAVVSLSDFQGQPVLVNFWATWCPPCKQEIPLLQAASDHFAEDLVVLAINGGDSEAQIQEFVDANGYDMMFLVDTENATSQEYLVRGFPTSFFIDGEGLIQAIHVGMLDEGLLLDYLAEIGVVE